MSWENCADICTDGTIAIMGHNNGAIARNKEQRTVASAIAFFRV